jgi:hypothetical protein
MIKNRQIIFPKVIYRTPPENAFMNVYFYFYCVVKCGNRALGINERIKKIFSDTKTNPNPPLSRSDRGPSGGPVPKGFRKRAPSGQWLQYDPSIPTMDINKNKIAIFLHFAAQRKFCGRILSSPVTDIYASNDDIPIVHLDTSRSVDVIASTTQNDNGAPRTVITSLQRTLHQPWLCLKIFRLLTKLPKAEAITNILSFLGAIFLLTISSFLGELPRLHGDIVGVITLKQSSSPNAKRQATRHPLYYYKQEISSADTPLAMSIKPVSGVDSWYYMYIAVMKSWRCNIVTRQSHQSKTAAREWTG